MIRNIGMKYKEQSSLGFYNWKYKDKNREQSSLFFIIRNIRIKHREQSISLFIIGNIGIIKETKWFTIS